MTIGEKEKAGPLHRPFGLPYAWRRCSSPQMGNDEILALSTGRSRYFGRLFPPFLALGDILKAYRLDEMELRRSCRKLDAFSVGLFVLGEAVDLGENDYHKKMLRYPRLMSK